MPDDPASIRLRVLGTTRLERGGRVEQLPSARQRRLLAVLAAAEGEPVGTDRLIDAVWGEDLPANPVGALQTQLSRLRQLFGPEATAAVRAGPGGYRLALARNQVDAWDFEDRVRAASAARPSPAVLDEAVCMWAGEPFTDASGHPAVEPIATVLRELYSRAVEDLAEAHLEGGDPVAALVVVEPVLLADPYRERARAVELRALYAAGRSAEALARYQEYRRRLATELGVDPSPMLQRVEHEILDHEILVATPVRSDPASHLPALPITSFVGRDRELNAALDLLARARIVTLVGPGGAGKTRLALHTAHRVSSDRPGGVWWCDLVSAGPGEVATVIASRLGVQERAGESIVDRLAGILADRRALVVLDNCEHLVQEAGSVVDRIVRSGPSVQVLATSRQPLGVDGEHRLRLGPLALAKSEEWSSPALELFVDRAQAVAPDFRAEGETRLAVIELCRQVGGLPLGIELAAASIARIDPRAVADRIGNHLRLLDRVGGAGLDRHDSLEGVLESSYSLLDSDEQTLLDRISVFAGPFTLDDVDTLDQSAPAAPASVLLGRLVEKSLVLFRADGRYEQLSPVQALGRRHLDAGGERPRWRARHAELVVASAARVDRILHTPDEPAVFKVFDEIVAELRTARTWLTETDDLPNLLAFCANLDWFCNLRLRSEIANWAADAVSRVREEIAQLEDGQARALAARGAANRGDLGVARTLAEDGAGVGGRFCVEVLGQVSLYEGRLEEAIKYSRSAASIHTDAGDLVMANAAATVEAVALAYGGHLSDAQATARRLARAADSLGVPSLRAMNCYVLAETLAEPAAAMELYTESLALAETVGADFVTGLANTSLAARELRAGYTTRARRRLGTVIEHWQRAGVRNQQWVATRLLIETLDQTGEHNAVATLAGAFQASTSAGPAYGEDATRLDHALNRAELNLGNERFAAAHAQGATLGDDQTALLARSLALRFAHQ